MLYKYVDFAKLQPNFTFRYTENKIRLIRISATVLVQPDLFKKNSVRKSKRYVGLHSYNGIPLIGTLYSSLFDLSDLECSEIFNDTEQRAVSAIAKLQCPLNNVIRQRLRFNKMFNGIFND